MVAKKPRGVDGRVPIYDAMVEELTDPAGIDWQMSEPPCFVAELTERGRENDVQLVPVGEEPVAAVNAASDS
ncbi:hypothetical protein [Saccharopolyspora sp. 5N708]|uniref:hypothetical protein n=1 Tax=Saccharopolyspora sp. 5N708 TaxID=3457424 RepID=UPI003FD61B4E